MCKEENIELPKTEQEQWYADGWYACEDKVNEFLEKLDKYIRKQNFSYAYAKKNLLNYIKENTGIFETKK